MRSQPVTMLRRLLKKWKPLEAASAAPSEIARLASPSFPPVPRRSIITPKPPSLALLYARRTPSLATHALQRQRPYGPSPSA